MYLTYLEDNKYSDELFTFGMNPTDATIFTSK